VRGLAEAMPFLQNKVPRDVEIMLGYSQILRGGPVISLIHMQPVSAASRQAG